MYNNPNAQRQQSYHTGTNPSPPKLQFRWSKHGAFGVGAIILMIIIASILRWNISWWYFVGATVGYASAVIVLTLMEEQTNNLSRRFLLFRWLVGCHIAFLLLVGGLAFKQAGFDDGAQVGIFLAAVALGIAIPFMLIKK